MRGHTGGIGSVEIVVRAIADEFPELDRDRLRAAVERASARIATASLDTAALQVVDMHLARAEATEEAAERAGILRELAQQLDERGDADRALVVRLSAFAEAPAVDDLDPLLRLARVTDRWAELPLDGINALIDIHDDAAARRLRELASGWQSLDRGYHAADCYERVLLIAPDDTAAQEALETFYRSTGEWPVLVDLLGRRAVHVATDHERAELYREIGLIYDRELADDSGALDAYREADRLDPDHPDALEALARLTVKVGAPDDEALTILERSGRLITDPKKRARVLVRAAELAKLENWNRASALFESARTDDPDLAEAVDGFVPLLRDRGQLADAINLLLAAAERPALAAHRSRWLTDAGDFCVALGDTDWAKRLYLDARVADPTNHKASAAIVELCWDGGQLGELAPMLDELCRVTDDPSRLRGYLLQRSKVASQIGDKTGARAALSRAIDLDPGDAGARRELADMLYDAQHWAKARDEIEAVLADEDLLPQPVAVELHYRLARCARELGDAESAAKQVDIALVLAPDHHASRVLRTELGSGDPLTRIADELALANVAPPEERATRFAAIGDRYSELGDRGAAREMYREALSHRAGDHLLLTKFLALVTEDGDWSYSLDVVGKLIDTEQDPKIRARYRHLAAMIARDELDDHELSTKLLGEALADDPMSFAAADELEAALGGGPDRDELVRFYYARLEQVRAAEGRAGEQLRLWDRLGELLLDLGHHGDALVAFEVGLTLAPDALDRRMRIADLYDGADLKHDATAIAHHQAILRADKRRVESYKALRVLHHRAGDIERARACDDALTELGVHTIDGKLASLFDANESLEPLPPPPRRTPTHPMVAEDWLALTRTDVDLQLSMLFAVVAPPFAVERARIRPPMSVPSKEPEVPAWITRVVDRVVGLLGTPRPPIYLERDQTSPCKLAMRVRDGQLVPVLLLGKPVLEKTIAEDELAFRLARQLADLRNDRVARLLCPRAGELAPIIELAIAPNKDLVASLHPVELDQARAIGARLRERAIHPMTAAATWLAATERAADRIGLVVTGDLACCTRVLERDASDALRIADLAWASVTDEVLAVRARVEGWHIAPAARPVARSAHL